VPDTLAPWGEEDRRQFDLAEVDEDAWLRGYAAVWGGLRDDVAWMSDLALPAGDRRVVDELGMREVFVEAFGEGLRDGTAGMAWDDLASFSRWGFELEDVTVRVRVWHGEDDPFVPRAHAEHLAAHLPDCRLVTWPGEAHLGLFSRWQAALAEALAAPPGKPERLSRADGAAAIDRAARASRASSPSASTSPYRPGERRWIKRKNPDWWQLEPERESVRAAWERRAGLGPPAHG
jgi:hypothetical protein